MNFTRDPLVQTVITPKEGFKLVIRNSKVGGQEEYFVDAIEVISFGNNCFFRSLEKPKCFLVPASDYEIFEARETRVALKTPGIEKGIKIGGGRDSGGPSKTKEAKEEEKASEIDAGALAEGKSGDKRRDRRRSRKKREKIEEEAEKQDTRFPDESETPRKSSEERSTLIIPPPSTLISETIGRYKDFEADKEPLSEKEEEIEASSETKLSEPEDQDKQETGPVSENEEQENDQEIPF